MSRSDRLLITCEHGGNRVPPRYHALFDEHQALLDTHRGLDFGALAMARQLAAAFEAPLYVSTTTRLLVDLNRSVGHAGVHSEVTRHLPGAVRDEIVRRHWRPYRTAVEREIRSAIDRGERVVHVSSHTFTPSLYGTVRNADIGLLYDPSRPGERMLVDRWRQSLRSLMPSLKVRRNYPYVGTTDGFTTSLRRRYPADRYVGVEIEINQKHALGDVRRWRALRGVVVESLRRALTWQPHRG